MGKHTECKVSKSKRTNKRVLRYVNNRTNRKYDMVVGKRGGLSYKSPCAKTRRYLGGLCKKTRCSKTFWKEAKRLHKKKNKR